MYRPSLNPRIHCVLPDFPGIWLVFELGLVSVTPYMSTVNTLSNRLLEWNNLWTVVSRRTVDMLSGLWAGRSWLPAFVSQKINVELGS